MTLRIDRTPVGRRTRIRLSGELRQEELDSLKAEIGHDGHQIILDLEELGLIDVEGIRFLNACEDEGVEVLHRAPYIREWMYQERAGNRRNRS